MKSAVFAVFAAVAVACSDPSHATVATPAPSCEPGFSGDDCQHVTLQPTPVQGGLRASDASYWDGSAILGDDGRWHLFASRMTNGCGLSAWQTNSECIRADGDSPLGPFTVAEVVTPAFCHNPTVRRAKDGTYLLFSIGATVDPSVQVTTCANGQTLSLPADAGLDTDICMIRVQSAASVLGPWQAPVALTNAGWIPLCPTNPSPILADDGSVTLFFRAYQEGNAGTIERLFLTTAPAWQGPYTQGALTPLFTREAEDPFVWSHGSGFRVFFNDKFTDATNVGGFALQDDDDGGAWTEAQAPAYSLDVSMSDGTTLQVSRRERPSITWLPGDAGAVLYTAVVPSAASDQSYVIATPL